VPFCDYRIAEYLYGVPWEYKDHQGKEKGLLRTAMEGILPEKVLWRKKSPYPKTFDPVYTELVESRLRRILQDKNAPILHILNASEAGRLLNTEEPWPWYGQLMKGPQTMAYLIQVDFWLRQYGIDFLF
jgi:asparagine synthase (glutamine-hydrolysing)